MYYCVQIKKFKLINHDCLPILMLLHIMLYIMLAYLMLFVCIILFLAIDFLTAFFHHALSWFIDTACLFQV